MNFSKLKDYVESLPQYGIPACDCIVYYKHSPVFRASAGFSDAAATKPVSPNDLYWCYSSSKVITCTAAMQLVEKGLLNLDDPVSKYIPAFSNMTVKTENGIVPCKKEMKIWNLFTMTNGFGYGQGDFFREIGMPHDTTTLGAIERIANEPLDFEPGEHFRYGYGHDILGAVIEVVSGMNLEEYMRENIWNPLKITNMYYYDIAPKERISEFYVVKDGKLEPNMQTAIDELAYFDHFRSGGGGIISTVDDYGVFADTLANNGVGITGNRIISKESIDLMRTNQLNETQLEDYYKGPGNRGYGYGLGVRTLISKDCAGNKSNSPLGEYGWGGADGTYALIDPENHIGIFHAQHIIGSQYNFTYQTHPHNMIRDLVYEALGLV